MGLTSGPVSFGRFLINGELPAGTGVELLDSVQEHAFGRSPGTADGLVSGWIGPRHLFETDIDARHACFGRYLLLALRIDRARIPSALLRSYIRIEEDAALEASGREFLSRAERRRARDAALSRAERELREGAHRQIRAAPVLIDVEGGTVLCGSTGTLVADRLMQTFSDTFGVGIEPQTPDRVAERLMTHARNTRALDTLTPMRLGRPPRDFADDAADGIETDRSWLGKELLTWLWFQSERNDAALRVRGGEDVTVMLDRTLRLRCDYGLTGVDAITADSPTRLPEAHAALAVGKQPVRAGLILGSPAGEARLTLDALRFTVSGLSIVEEETEGDARARLEARFERIIDSANLLDALFDVFLQRRCARDWAAEQKEMTAWAQGRREAPALRAAQ
ncbi:MAG: hypothetical protein IPM64_05460 [Phycisphaerales bacterium]|nr:hypothetical protein [Phycisphaerales bacterium]